MILLTGAAGKTGRAVLGALTVLPLPYPPETRLSLVDLRDVAEVAARELR